MRDPSTFPFGQWTNFFDLPSGTTEESLSEFLNNECGLRIPPDAISVREYEDPRKVGASAIVVIPNHEIVSLVNWVIDGRQMDGRAVVAHLPAKKPAHKRERD